MRILSIFFFIPMLSFAQSKQRIESEYKLDIPVSESPELWEFLTSNAFLEGLPNSKMLTTSISEEKFIDVYFDDEKERLYTQLVGLRYRSRFKNDTLIKQLVQLKTPISAEGVARNEIKYDIKKSKDKNDLYARHDLLKYIKKRDRKDINYQLAKFGTRSVNISTTHTLEQNRKRIYISDSTGSLATLTLDRVVNASFPYQLYTELELELNELRYTHSAKEEKKSMEIFNATLKNTLTSQFSNLKQDQTPKYNKMKNIIDESKLSFIFEYRMWLILLCLLVYAFFIWLRNT